MLDSIWDKVGSAQGSITTSLFQKIVIIVFIVCGGWFVIREIRWSLQKKFRKDHTSDRDKYYRPFYQWEDVGGYEHDPNKGKRTPKGEMSGSFLSESENEEYNSLLADDITDETSEPIDNQTEEVDNTIDEEPSSSSPKPY